MLLIRNNELHASKHLISTDSRNNAYNSIFPLFSHDLHKSSTTKIDAILQNMQKVSKKIDVSFQW